MGRLYFSLKVIIQNEAGELAGYERETNTGLKIPTWVKSVQ